MDNMDTFELPDADTTEENPAVAQDQEQQQGEENPYYFEDNPMNQNQMPPQDAAEEEPYYYEEQQQPQSQSNMQQTMMTPEPQQDAWMMPEPEREDALTAFNKIWNEKLEVKRAAEFAAEKASRTKAAEDMVTWTSQRDIRLHAKKDTNRSEEQILLETMESEADAANIWDRVGKLIDANNDAVAAGNADTARMRKLFIQLKNEPLESTRSASA